MRERARDKERLRHMEWAITTALANRTRYTYDEFVRDPMALFGMAKMVEIVGEAVFMLTREFKSSHPEVPWTAIQNMRHVLVHGYYTMEPKTVWDTIWDDFPALLPHLHRYLDEP